MVHDKIKIGNVELDTRIIMPPIATYQSTEDGKVTDGMLAYYGARAKNPHVALITTEHCFIHQQGKAKPKQMSIADDSDIPGLTRLVEAIHAGGAKAICQLNHAGSASPSAATGMPVVGPSPVVLPSKPVMGDNAAPVELTKDQIADIVRWFADAALRAKKAGYDGVEIHSAHAYLLNQFYSPLTNKRTDEYGGSLDHRLNIHREVIAAVRKAVGDDYLISLRLGGCDYAEGGSTIEDSVYASKVFKAAGVDMLSISGGMCRYTIPGHDEPGYFKEMTLAIKKEVKIPVMLTGGVKTLQEAEELLAEGAADLIGVGRQLLKDPEWEM